MRHPPVDSYVQRTYVASWPASASNRTPRRIGLTVANHGVSFEEAETVFADEHALLIDDPDHSASEDRFVLLGLSARFRVLLVVHSYRERDEVIRIISARRATKPERERYDERWRA
jgi:uncharacterized DUF497 family protein